MTKVQEYKDIREVYPGIYLNEITLPKNPLKYINNYIIKSQDESLMVDTCFNTPLTVERMEEILDYHAIDPSKLKLVFTHLHSDHTGLSSWFEDKGTELYMSDIDGQYVKEMVSPDSSHWVNIEENALMQGLEEDHLLLEEHPGFRYRPTKPINYQPLNPGDEIRMGNYHFSVIDLKGHTPGMIGLYEEDHKILFCGDHILGKITPNITFWKKDFDALANYFENLEKVKNMDIDLLLSAHRFLIDDHRARVDELFAHHEERLQEALDSMEKNGPSTVRDITKNLQWDISAKNWDDFPNSQKWFAAGEAHAHLEYLYHLDKCKREIKDGVLYYSV